MLLLMGAGGVVGFISFWWLIIPLTIYFVCISLGSYFIELNYFVNAINKGPTKEKKIALTFDDGPLHGYTENILRLLAEKKIKASFFLIGKNVEQNPTLVRSIHQNGHFIGCHGFEHSNGFPFWSVTRIKDDIEKSNAAILHAVGTQASYFRPPFGVTNPNIAKAVQQLQLKVIGWSLRSYDTSITNEQKLFKRLLKAKEGDIILLHDWPESTLNILPTFIDEYQKRGFEFVRLDELIV